MGIKKVASTTILLVIFSAGPLLAKPAVVDVPRWFSSIEEASLAAQESNRPMMLDFWADWCAACKVMDADVYRSDVFLGVASQFVFVKLDFDKKNAIARKYGVVNLPTLVFTDSYGGALFRYEGYIGAKPLAELIRALPSDVTPFNKLDRILAEDKNNFEALQAMGENLRAAGLYLTSNDYYARALQRNEAKGDPSTRERILTDMGLNLVEVKDGKRAVELYEKCLKEFPSSANQPEWTLNLGRAYVIEQKKDKARQVLENFLREHLNGKEAEQAKSLLSSL
jgi:thioredoxin-like negative regulator of GroEL